jgi:hypothetical protein
MSKASALAFAVLVTVAAAVASGLAGAASSTSADDWKSLRRPLHIPHIAAGSKCPASAPNTNFDFAANGVGQGYGPGPAYPVFPYTPPRAGLDFDYPPPRESGSKWGGQKVLWFLAPGNGPRVLVRGRQLDGSNRVRFGFAPTPVTELRIIGSGGHPATTRLRTGGCYGYQIDGRDYSRVIMFKANLRCLAAPVEESRVHAGPFTGLIIMPEYDVVDGRFRLHVGRYRDRARGLSQKMPWFLPRKYAAAASGVSVRGVRLAPPGRRFSDSLAEAFGPGFPDDQHVYPSAFEPPTAGCWRLTLKTGPVKGSLVVLVRNG